MTKLNNLKAAEPTAQQDAQPSEEPNVDATQGPSATQSESDSGKVFTQEEVNELIAKRLEREKKKFADYHELKEKATEYEKALEEKRLAELSEQERLQELAKKHEAEKEELAKQLSELQTKTRQQALVNEFIKAAPSVNIPSDRIDAALKLADLSEVNVSEDGKVEGLDSVMTSLIEQYSFLAEETKPQKPVGQPSNNGGQRPDKTKEQLLEEAAEKARKTGRTEDLAAYAQLKRELSR